MLSTTRCSCFCETKNRTVGLLIQKQLIYHCWEHGQEHDYNCNIVTQLCIATYTMLIGGQGYHTMLYIDVGVHVTFRWPQNLTCTWETYRCQHYCKSVFIRESITSRWSKCVWKQAHCCLSLMLSARGTPSLAIASRCPPQAVGNCHLIIISTSVREGIRTGSQYMTELHPI